MSSKELPVDLLALLADGKYHSGEAIGGVLGISRAAVWKRLQSFQEFGLAVESVKGKGYCLANGVRLFDVDALNEELPALGIRSIDYHYTTDSTNTQLMKALSEGRADNAQLVIAEQQSAGRGRRGRQWVSPFGENLYLSLNWNFEQGASRLEGLSLVVGMALAKTLISLGYEGVELKWPNDVLVNGKKLAGILLEITGDPNGLCYVVIGVGVNVNMNDGKGAIDQAWTSLKLMKALRGQSIEAVNKTELLICFMRHLTNNLEKFEKHGFAAFTSQWQELDALSNKEVLVYQGEQVISGQCLGVNDQGEIRIKTSFGEEVFNGGEVSIRKSL